MERELGVQLLRRRPRGVELTDAGRALLADARAMCAHVDRAIDSTRRAGSRAACAWLCRFIRTSLAKSNELALHALLEEPMVAALSSNHTRVNGEREATITMRQLADETFILYGAIGPGATLS